MGQLIQFPTPACPTPNDTGVVLRGCWACGLILFDDEHDAGLCTECAAELDRQPAPPGPKEHPLSHYLRGIRPETLRSMADAIVETGVTRAEETAAAWARDHDVDEPARGFYVGDVRGRAQVELSQRCHDDAQRIGAELGWWKRP